MMPTWSNAFFIAISSGGTKGIIPTPRRDSFSIPSSDRITMAEPFGRVWWTRSVTEFWSGLMPSIRRCGLHLTGFALPLLFVPGSAADPARSVRTPWTTSQVTGSADPPPPYKVVRAFPDLKFDHPLLLARAPGMDRLFVGEQDGVLYSFPDRPDAKAELFFDLRKEVRTIKQLPGGKDIESVYGLT